MARQSLSSSPGTTIRTQTRLRDLVGLSALPVVLTVVFALPRATRRSLALDYGTPTVVGAYANHFVHLSVDHLLANLLGYALIVPVAYLLAVAAGRRRQFWLLFAVFLLAFPFALSGVNLIAMRADNVRGLGFSGVLMAFLGYLPVAITVLLGEELRVKAAWSHSGWLFFAGMAVVAVLAVPGTLGRALAGLSGVLVIVTAVPAVREAARTGLPTRGRVGSTELVLAALVVYFGYPLLAFPTDLTVSGGRINTYSHAMGFGLGYLVTYGILLSVGKGQSAATGRSAGSRRR